MNFTNVRVFVDTNLLVYSVDASEKTKRDTARRVLARLNEESCPVISTQVLQEFYNAATAKLGYAPAIAKTMMQNFGKMEWLSLSLSTIESGIDISADAQISFWDGLIIAAAATAKCSMVFTEDLNDGQIISGVKVVNPFRLSIFAS